MRGGANWTLVWNNPNPTSAFAQQTITLSKSLENFTEIRIEFKSWTSATSGLSTEDYMIGEVGKVYCLSSVINRCIERRNITFQSYSTLSLEDCRHYQYNSTSYTITNDTIIPFAIYAR